MQSLKPVDVFFIAVRLLGATLVTYGVYWCFVSSVVLSWSRGTNQQPLAAMAPLLLNGFFNITVGGLVFLFADSLASKWFSKRTTTVPAMFIALAGLFLLSVPVADLPAQVIGLIRTMSAPGPNELFEMLRTRFVESMAECLGGIVLFLCARPLARLFDADTPQGWLYRRRVAIAIRDIEELKD